MPPNANRPEAGTSGTGICNQAADAGSKSALIATSQVGNLAPLDPNVPGRWLVDRYRAPVRHDDGNDVSFDQAVARGEIGSPYLRIYRLGPRWIFPNLWALQFVDVVRNTHAVFEYHGSRQAAELAAIWTGEFIDCVVFGSNRFQCFCRRPRKKQQFRHREYLKRQRLVAGRQRVATVH
jgi:hypothetical protein